MISIMLKTLLLQAQEPSENDCYKWIKRWWFPRGLDWRESEKVDILANGSIGILKKMVNLLRLLTMLFRVNNDGNTNVAGYINASGNIYSGSNIIANGSISTGDSIYAKNSIYTGSDSTTKVTWIKMAIFMGQGNAQLDGNVNANGNINSYSQITSSKRLTIQEVSSYKINGKLLLVRHVLQTD